MEMTVDGNFFSSPIQLLHAIFSVKKLKKSMQPLRYLEIKKSTFGHHFDSVMKNHRVFNLREKLAHRLH